MTVAKDNLKTKHARKDAIEKENETENKSVQQANEKEESKEVQKN